MSIPMGLQQVQKGSIMGIQHAPKSQRNAAKKRRKARKHKLRSTKKYKAK
ncbi:MAG TPA: hypothetical protein VLM40_09185 [Gemmata sp.]|nr:hypothetical protein [Gemmata sp.]